MARLSVSAGGLLGEYKSCRDRNGRLDDERENGREELRRIRSVVNSYDVLGYRVTHQVGTKLSVQGRYREILVHF